MNYTKIFFGRGGQSALPLFSTEHLTILALTVAAVAALAVFAPKLRTARRDATIRFAILIILIVEQATLVTYRVFTNPRFNPAVDLPLHLCHFAAFFCIIYLATLNRKIFSVAAFWGIIGCVAILIPDFQNHFPHLEIWIFFFGHLGILAAVAYGFFVRQTRLTTGDLKIILTVSVLATLLIIPANRLLHANYFYLMQAPPALASLPNWLYISGLIVVYFSLVLLIFLLFRQRKNLQH